MMITSNVTQGTTTVQGGGGVYTAAATPSFTTGGPSTSGTITSSIDKFMIFTSTGVDNAFTVPANFNCDILMIGGGGGGDTYSGGGAGACIVAINQTLPAGSCYVIVGSGGGVGVNGQDSYIYYTSGDVGTGYRYRAKGGGFGAPAVNLSPGGNGGCGGGGAFNTTAIGGSAVSTNVVVLSSGLTSNIGPCISSTFAVMGNKGGDSTANISGSGGGIGTAGTVGGKGGDGVYQVTLTTSPTTTINFRNYFANGGTFGVQDGSTGNYYIGGGGGSYNSGYQDGGLGGGGKQGAASGVPNTGGGALSTNSGASGIVIIRYRISGTTTTYTHEPTTTTTLSTPTLGTPSIELVRGTQGDSNTDYKIGNYNGDFIIKSSVSSTDTDRLNITTAGNVGIGITNPAVKLQVAGGDFACSGDISAYFSDERLKTRISNIKDPLEIIGKLNGFYYIPNDLARYYGIKNMAQEIGLSAQDVRKVLPELVKIAPFDLTIDEDDNKVSKSGENYLTISYDRLAPVFVEAIKELRCSNVDLTEKYNRLLERFVNDEKL
jgi:hypothetical protein